MAGASSLTDVLTSIQNLVQAVNGASSVYAAVQGKQTASAISAATLVKPNAGRVAMVSITTAGSAPGTIYDTNTAASTARPIFAIPNTLGVIFVNLPTSYGIVVAPGTSQVVSVSWS